MPTRFWRVSFAGVGRSELIPIMAAVSVIERDIRQNGTVRQGRTTLSFENLTAELSLLVDEIYGDQGDRHEIYLRIREKLGELKAMGMPLTEDLVRMERNPEAEFDADMGYIL